MPDSGIKFRLHMPSANSKTGIIKKLLAVLGVIAFLLICSLAGLVILLPKIVSSAQFKSFLENQASTALNRNLQIGALKWEETDEIIIKKLNLKDDPAFSKSPMLAAEHARFQIFWGEILKGRLRFDVLLDGVRAGIIRNKQGQTNLAVLLAGLKHPEAAPKKPAPIDLNKMSFTVPFDIQGRVHINNVAIRMDDRIQAKQLALENAEVRFDLPSLYHKPLTLKASTAIIIDGHQIPAAYLNVLIKNLFDPQGSLTLADAHIVIKGTGPGAEFGLDGNFSQRKLISRLDCDLSKLTKILKPLLPPRALPDKITGHLKFVLDGSGNPLESLSFSTTFGGQGLVFSGGVLEDKALGPLDFNMTNSGILDAGSGRLAFENGTLALLNGSRLAWNGELKKLGGATPEADLQFDSIRLDLAELVDRFKTFMPEGITIEGQTRQQSPFLEINNAGFSGPLPSGPYDLRIKDLNLKVPGLRFSSRGPQGPALAVNDFRLAVKNLSSTLKDFFPAEISLTAALVADSLDVKGTQDIKVKKLSIPDITVFADNIRKSPNPLIGMSARFNVREALTISEIRIPPLIMVNDFQETLNAEVELPADTPARLAIKNVMLKIPALIIASSNYGPFKTSAGLDCGIEAITLLDTDPLDVDIQGVKSGLWVDTILAADFKADARNMAKESVKAKGNVVIDMAQLSEKLIAKFNTKLKLTGETKLNWDIAGRLPNAQEMTKLGSLAVDFKADLGFVDRLNIDCTVQEMGVDLAISESKHLQVASVSTGSAMRYRFDKQTGKGQSDGKILLRGIHLPYGVLDKGLSADIIVTGEHDGFESITFSQIGMLKPANIKHTLNLSLSGMDRVYKRSLKMPLPLWLKYVGGIVHGTLDVAEQADLTTLVDNLDFEGRLETGAELLLTPNENIRLKGWASSPKINVKLGELFGVKNLTTNINLEKDYRIVESEAGAPDKNRFRPLSVRVLEAESEPAASGPLAFETQDAAVAKLIGALHNRFSPRQALEFESAYLGIGPWPLAVERSAIGFDLNAGLPNSDYFQVELLGGTVIGSLGIMKSSDIFFLKMQLAFSGLNTGRISPAAQELEGGAGELSGRLTAVIPLASRFESLLRELAIDLKLSRIGSRSLERLLYALDPAESNEAIVSQRQLLRLGSPRWISVQIKDGNLSLDGEVDVQGALVAIPSLRRLNVTNIAGLEKYADYLAGLKPLIKALKFCSANAVKIGEDGRILKFRTLR